MTQLSFEAVPLALKVASLGKAGVALTGFLLEKEGLVLERDDVILLWDWLNDWLIEHPPAKRETDA